MHIKDYEKAKESVEDVLSVNNKNADAYHKLGEIYELMELNHSALNSLEVNFPTTVKLTLNRKLSN